MLETYRRLEENFLTDIPPYPDTCSSRGIVTACGSKECFYVGAYVMIRLLRHFGCHLPVEVYKFDWEQDESWDKIFNAMPGVTVKYYDKTICAGVERKGWSLKPFAILDSSFEEVLFLDSDVAPAKNPEYLFDYAGYQETGAVFWADTHATHRKARPTPENSSRNAFWHLAGREEIDEPEFESGQIVVNKRKCWRELQLAGHYNKHADWYYKFFLGDKETFHLAWRRLDTPFAFLTNVYDVPVPGGKYFYQHDHNDELVFQHRSGNKLHLGENLLQPEFVEQDKILEFIAELRDLREAKCAQLA
jgi:hypothetical protein